MRFLVLGGGGVRDLIVLVPDHCLSVNLMMMKAEKLLHLFTKCLKTCKSQI